MLAGSWLVVYPTVGGWRRSRGAACGCWGAGVPCRRLMRVLHAISGFNRESGGPPIVLHGRAAAQVRAGLDVRVVATWTTDPVPGVVAQLQGRGVKVTHIGPARNPMSRHPDTPRVLEELVRE